MSRFLSTWLRGNFATIRRCANRRSVKGSEAKAGDVGSSLLYSPYIRRDKYHSFSQHQSSLRDNWREFIVVLKRGRLAKGLGNAVLHNDTSSKVSQILNILFPQTWPRSDLAARRDPTLTVFRQNEFDALFNRLKASNSFQLCAANTLHLLASQRSVSTITDLVAQRLQPSRNNSNKINSSDSSGPCEKTLAIRERLRS